MSWLYLPSACFPASECSTKDCEPASDIWASRIAPFATLSGKLTRPASWLRAWKKAPWMRHLSGPTLPPSTQQLGAARWIASLPDSRVRTYPSPAAASGLTASDPDSSLRLSGLPPIAVRGSSFWRTSQASLVPPPPLWTKPKALLTNAQPPASWENWPTSGGIRNGSLFQRPTWVPRMAAQGGSASHGRWDTPDSMPEAPNTGSNRKSQVAGLGNQAKSLMWMAPHGMSGMEAESGKAGAGGEFAKQATQWSSPRATDGTKGGPNQRGSKGDLMLPSMVAQWPTPAARDHKGANSEQHATVTGGGRKHMDQLANFVAYSPLAQATRDGQESLSDSLKSPRHLVDALIRCLANSSWDGR